MLTIDSLIERAGSLNTGRDLMIEAAGRRASPREFSLRVRALSIGLGGLGLGKGAVVGLLALNSVAYGEVVCATICAGLVSAPLNLRWSQAELEYAAKDANIEALIVDSNFAALGAALLQSCDSVKQLIIIGGAEAPEGAIAYESLFGEAGPLDLSRDPATECLISYTGGTTGFPKGVVHSHTSLLSSALNMAVEGLPNRNSVYLLGVPMFHASGFAFFFARLLQLGPMVILPQFAPNLLSAAVREHGAEEMGLVPTMLQMIISDPGFKAEDFASMKRIFYGAAPISQALLEKVSAALPMAELNQAFGMTEVGVTMALGPQFHTGPLAKPGACGQPLAFTKVLIENEDGSECAVGEIGELVLYGPSVMVRYHNKPQETAEALRNGGLRSGDMGFKDADGVITLCDRAKDMIITGGENVYSVEVENVIAAHPDVAQVAIIGIPDEHYGELVHAVIVPVPGKQPSFEEIKDHCKAHLAGYKCPRSISLVEALPMSAMNKVLKNVLRASHEKVEAGFS